MIIVMRAEATAAQRDGVREQVEASGGRSYAARDGNRTVLGCLGDTDALSEDNVEALPGVESVTRWRTPYRLASRELAPPGGRTVVRIGDGPAAPALSSVIDVFALVPENFRSPIQTRSTIVGGFELTRRL